MPPRGTGGQTDAARQTRPARDDSGGDEALTLIEQVVRRENLVAAHARVVHNGGAPGVDGMTVDELLPYCRRHWARIREQLLSGTYVPQPVRRVDIPNKGPDPAGKMEIPACVTMSHVLKYFAYGSNLCSRRLRETDAVSVFCCSRQARGPRHRTYPNRPCD